MFGTVMHLYWDYTHDVVVNVHAVMVLWWVCLFVCLFSIIFFFHFLGSHAVCALRYKNYNDFIVLVVFICHVYLS